MCPLEITWYGLSCFRITERGRISVVTDPFSPATGLPELKLKADVVTISHDSTGHNYVEAVKIDPYVVRGPGEYEIGGVFITGLALHDQSAPAPKRNVAYLFDYDNLKVMHLGDLDHVPSQSLVQEIGVVNVLLVPVGGGMGLKAAQAAEVVALIEPHLIVPMHYHLPGLRYNLDPIDKFLKAMGVTRIQEADSLKVTATDLPEQLQVIVLHAQSLAKEA